MALFNLKVLIVKVGKLDVYGRPLFANPVTYYVVWHLQHMSNRTMDTYIHSTTLWTPLYLFNHTMDTLMYVEYAVYSWAPHTRCNIDKLESVQR